MGKTPCQSLIACGSTAIWTMRLSPRSGPTARSTVACVASTSRASVPPAGRASTCSRNRLDELRDDAAAQADELFPAERLAVQHAQISVASKRPNARRASSRSRSFRAPLTSPHVARIPLDCCGRSRRPHRRGRRRAGDGSPPHRQRLSRRKSRRAWRHRHSPLAIEPSPVVAISNSGEDEAFLSDLDASLSRPSVPELRAIDELTPRAGEQPR